MTHTSGVIRPKQVNKISSYSSLKCATERLRAAKHNDKSEAEPKPRFSFEKPKPPENRTESELVYKVLKPQTTTYNRCLPCPDLLLLLQFGNVTAL